ncbi:uncharacterized protein LOC130433884 isoform X3 [Triplophysa dalaica]|uniref:uncharacterized protein LOC130433884 isoform X3 n=1 Tax=Triplophysa dalaica TaxID=1582913 RepID=UPI0024DFA1A1|nr:uncharacterized protein LOC130433884 isoform X3 [Triplophysa dalaica]
MFGVKGDDLSVQCLYDPDDINNDKLFCKDDNLSLCETSGVHVSKEKITNGSFSLIDDTSVRVFTSSYHHKSDRREFWDILVWKRNTERISTRTRKFISEVILKISKRSFFGSQVPLYFGPTPHISEALLTAVSGEITSESTSHKPTTASFHTTPPVSTDSSSRPATSSPPSPTSSTSSSSSHSLSSNTETSLGLFGFITLSVTGMLILFGFVLFFYFTRRKKNEQLQLSGDSAGNLKNGAVRQTMVSDCDYEEIHLPNVHPDYSLVLPSSGEHDASVYALAQNVSSNNLHYSTIKFTELSHRTSDGQTSCDYATVVL